MHLDCACHDFQVGSWKWAAVIRRQGGKKGPTACLYVKAASENGVLLQFWRPIHYCLTLTLASCCGDEMAQQSVAVPPHEGIQTRFPHLQCCSEG